LCLSSLDKYNQKDTGGSLSVADNIVGVVQESSSANSLHTEIKVGIDLVLLM
jgi:hypothetical protein